MICDTQTRIWKLKIITKFAPNISINWRRWKSKAQIVLRTRKFIDMIEAEYLLIDT